MRMRTYIGLNLIGVSHATASYPVCGQLGRATSCLCNLVKGIQVLVRVVAEVLRGIPDEEVPKIGVSAIRALPLFDAANEHAFVFVVEWLH